MNWEALTAVGTVSAAVVGIIGIWINVFEKTRRLSIRVEYVPTFVVYVVNKSLRTVMVTKIMLCIKEHIFYVDIRDGLNEMIIEPGGIQKLKLDYKEVELSYRESQLGRFCNPSDRISIILQDNYTRHYKKKTNMTIGMFEE